MNRNEFEALRNLHGKLIRKDVVFVRRHQAHPLLTAELEIEKFIRDRSPAKHQLQPGGRFQDVFIVNDTPMSPASATPAKPLRLSDLGQTIAWLLDVGVRPWQSKKRQALIEDVLRLYDVQQDGGALFIDLKPGDDLMVGILRLAQSCIRVADLTFTRRASLQSPFSDDVEEVLADAELRFEVGAELVGRTRKPVRVDYLVTGQTKRSAVLALSALNAQSAHHSANEIFVGGSISMSPGGITRT